MTAERNKVLDLLGSVTTLNLEEPLRKGGLIELPKYGQVVMTGDFHGYRANFDRLRRFADLERCPGRQVVVHELIHCGGDSGNRGSSGVDDSCELLFDALQWKMQFPEQVHFLLGNHDLAQITGREITKGGAASIAGFSRYVQREFGDAGDEVLAALRELLSSFALAVRCANGIWLSHSLPGPRAMDDFETGIFARQWQREDLLPGGSVYELVWGRGHTAGQLHRLAEMFDAQLFVVGHQGQSSGFDCQFDRMIILASDHSQGCFLPINLADRYEFADLVERIRHFHLFETG